MQKRERKAKSLEKDSHIVGNHKKTNSRQYQREKEFCQSQLDQLKVPSNLPKEISTLINNQNFNRQTKVQLLSQLSNIYSENIKKYENLLRKSESENRNLVGENFCLKCELSHLELNIIDLLLKEKRFDDLDYYSFQHTYSPNRLSINITNSNSKNKEPDYQKIIDKKDIELSKIRTENILLKKQLSMLEQKIKQKEKGSSNAKNNSNKTQKNISQNTKKIKKNLNNAFSNTFSGNIGNNIINKINPINTNQNNRNENESFPHYIKKKSQKNLSNEKNSNNNSISNKDSSFQQKIENTSNPYNTINVDNYIPSKTINNEDNRLYQTLNPENKSLNFNKINEEYQNEYNTINYEHPRVNTSCNLIGNSSNMNHKLNMAESTGQIPSYGINKIGNGGGRASLGEVNRNRKNNNMKSLHSFSFAKKGNAVTPSMGNMITNYNNFNYTTKYMNTTNNISTSSNIGYKKSYKNKYSSNNV
ncbi:MAG: hypothetical protein MJ252_12380, partial [archaeon]|nr:hypothetical protein [archaeon]